MRSRYRFGALAGLLAALVALGVAELIAAVVRPQASPVVAVGGSFIDATPVWLKDLAIRAFGTNDKPVLIGSILVVLILLSLVTGALAVRRRVIGLAGVAVLGLVGAAAAATRPDAQLLDPLPSLIGAVVGSAALLLILRPLVESAASQPLPDESRRRFLVIGLVAAAVGVAAGAVGRFVTGRRTDVTAARAAVKLPTPMSEATPVPRGTDLKVPGLSSFHTPNADFYRVDTALIVPQVSTEGYTLRIHGMVEKEMELDFEAILARDLIERDITLACVSNEVGGKYVGNARWLGAPLADLLDEVGVDPEADMLLSRSVDGMSIGTPTAVVMDGRDAMLAIGMNGEPLPAAHGFPVRMVVPGLYGYVSATKWLVDLELTRFDKVDPYWVERGWVPKAPIKTMSRTDTPKPFAMLQPGKVAVAGVAWAQQRGVDKVEVRVDEGPWQEARLAEVPSIDTWRQWVWEWDAKSGSHRIEVRATDSDGTTQTDK
ncbi:MAG: molybdopterin-dependent oxidoreductase, partial [Spirochaetaceae bacterium]|nr:molybdopterin-dependent oxidoreductase [Spirochaetaceae bacterium]